VQSGALSAWPECSVIPMGIVLLQRTFLFPD
jgi:hypothetical protein